MAVLLVAVAAKTAAQALGGPTLVALVAQPSGAA